MKIKNSMTDKELWDEMRSVAFNRDFKDEIKDYIKFLHNKGYDCAVEKFKELFLVRN